MQHNMDIVHAYLPNNAIRYILVAVVIAVGAPTIHELYHPL